MEIISEDEFRLEDNLSKCRCCFRTLIDEQKFIKITKTIEQKFYDLTQIQLVEATVLSNKICQLCSNDLEVFSQFRRDLTAKQKALYNQLQQKQPEIASHVFNEVKSEINEFIDCNPASNDEDLFPQVKVELDEIEALDSYKELEDSLHQYATSSSWNQPLDKSKFLSCKICSFKSRTRKLLAEHIGSVHGVDDGGTSSTERGCPICGSKVRELNRHIKKVHLNIKNYHCDICAHGTFFKTEMELHMKIHSKKELQNFYCEFCSREFDKRHLLNRHIKLKHTEKQRLHQCSQCSKSFFTISTLKKHVESHRAKDMPCEFCGKLFSCMNNLRTHLYYHSEPKFVCEFDGCDKKFFMRKLLKAHMNVHRGQKDFGCSYCEKSYFFQSHLKRHIISTHMKLKIDCEVISCSSTFARKETYRNHVLQHHQNLGPDALESLLTKIRRMKVEEYRCVG